MNTWTCTTCTHPIADDEGAISVPYSDLTDMPMFGPEWEPRHYLCRHPEEPCYEIPVSDLRDDRGVLAWTAHLLNKVWLANSNWNDIIRSTVKEVSH